jgi:peptide/nickel transport system substrate-binding protein
MSAMWRGLCVILLISLVGCAPSAPAPSPTGASASGAAQAPVQPQRPATPKRLTLAIISEPVGFNLAIETQRLSVTQAGLAYFLFPGLTVQDHREALHATVGEAVPSIENGLWKLLPDGRMETTHPIRAGAKWHDGTPLTGEDLAFTISVLQDRELPQFRQLGIDLIERVEARDRTAVVTWKQPFVDADALFGMIGNSSRSNPLPKHLLQDAYLSNKAGFTELRYWSEEFVGIGPYRLKEWVRGSHLTLVAFDGYPLGRPKIDEIDVRFIPDPNTMIANMMSGAVHMPYGSIVGMDQAVPVSEQWRDGKVVMDTSGWVVAYPQMIDPEPRIVLNVQFRRALLYAVDRQQLVDTLMQGQVKIADNVFSPGTAEYEATQGGIVRYEYDPARASRMLAELGYTRSADGTLRDAGGQPLHLEVRAYAQRDIHQKAMFPLVDYWKQVGVGAESVALPATRAQDAQEQATFPSFLVLRQGNGLDRLVALHSAQARVPERNYQGTNNGRYRNPELDALIDRFQATIPMTERMQAATQIVRHFNEQLPVLPLFYDALPLFVHGKLTNVHAQSNMAWNVHEWDLS